MWLVHFYLFGYKAKCEKNIVLILVNHSHDQNFTVAISTYLKYGRRYNNNWGTLKWCLEQKEETLPINLLLI
jgi:hypothetical protein